MISVGCSRTRRKQRTSFGNRDAMRSEEDDIAEVECQERKSEETCKPRAIGFRPDWRTLSSGIGSVPSRRSVSLDDDDDDERVPME